jgi:hypothetical protein
MHLPEHQGRQVAGHHIAFSGKDDGWREDEPLPVDEPVVLVIRGKVTGDAFKVNAFGVMNLVQSFKVSDAILGTEELARELEQEVKRRIDETAGQTSLDDDLEGADDE